MTDNQLHALLTGIIVAARDPSFSGDHEATLNKIASAGVMANMILDLSSKRNPPRSVKGKLRRDD